ncbi:MAG: alpha/beta hydrolase [Pseudomonadota bacterium]
MTVLGIITFVVLATYLLFQFMLRQSPPPPPIHLLNCFCGLLFPDTHRGRPTPAPSLSSELRYPEVQRPPNTANLHGEIEWLEDGTEATHWYAQAADVTFHFVTAGNPANTPVVMLHGLPESWWAFHHQISDLARDHYVIALDCKGYGQSDKRIELDYYAGTQAEEVAALLDHLGVDHFMLVAHDRGAVIADHMTSVPALAGRIARYVRMQQSFNEPHGEPAPPHDLFATKMGEANFKSPFIIDMIYDRVMQAGLTPSTKRRLSYEFKFEGVAEAVRRYFGQNNFRIEMQDRQDKLFASMTMPLLILQGKYDPGQHMEEYAHSADYASDLSVQFVEANHFAHIENPRVVNAAIRRFITTSD